MSSNAQVGCVFLCVSAESMRGYMAEKNLPLSLVGSSYDGVSVNDVINSGRVAVERLLGPIP